MTLAVAEALNPNKPNQMISVKKVDVLHAVVYQLNNFSGSSPHKSSKRSEKEGYFPEVAHKDT